MSSFAVSLLFNERVFHEDTGFAVSLSTVTEQDPRDVFRVPLPLLSPLNFSQEAQGFSPSIEIFTMPSPSQILRLMRYASLATERSPKILPRRLESASPPPRINNSALRLMPSGFSLKRCAI